MNQVAPAERRPEPVEIPRLDLDRYTFSGVDALAEAVRRDGFAYIPAALTQDEVQETRVRLDALTPNAQANDRHGIKKFIDDEGNEREAYEAHTKCVFNQDAYFLQFLDRAPAADVADAVMGDDCHIIGQSGWINGPGRADQQLHADYQPLEIPEDVMRDPRVEIPVYIATCHYYLTDITDDLAPTIFVPGSHRAGRPPSENETEWNGVGPHRVVCNAGDAVFFRSEVWHRGSANTTDQTRYLLQVHYGRRMMAQVFPPFLEFRFDADVLSQANDRQRRYLGEHKFANYA